MTCGRSCRYQGRHTDAARRIADVTQEIWADKGWEGFVGSWMSFRLHDGVTNHDLYPKKQDAVRHVDNEFHYMFLKMHPNGMTICEAEIMLEFHRKAYDAGFRLADPDAKSGGPDIIPRIGAEKIRNQIIALKGGKT